MSRFMITGINGFIGSHIAQRLISLNHQVHGLVRSTSDLTLIKDYEIELHYGDITEASSLNTLMKEAEVVIHVAGLASDWDRSEKFEQVNVAGTQNVARAASAAGVRRFVHISSTAIHGFLNKRYLNESSVLPETIFPYCQTKKRAEQWLFEFSKSSQMEITAIRPGNVFGPQDHTFIEKYLQALECGKIAYIDSGKHWTCPTYIENLVDAILAVSFNPAAIGEVFIITDGLEIDWKSFTVAFADALGTKPPRISVPFTVGYTMAFMMEMFYKLWQVKTAPLLTRYRISNGGRDYHFSIEKAGRILNFEPKISFAEAIKQTITWYLNR